MTIQTDEHDLIDKLAHDIAEELRCPECGAYMPPDSIKCAACGAIDPLLIQRKESAFSVA